MSNKVIYTLMLWNNNSISATVRKLLAFEHHYKVTRFEYMTKTCTIADSAGFTKITIYALKGFNCFVHLNRIVLKLLLNEKIIYFISNSIYIICSLTYVATYYVFIVLNFYYYSTGMFCYVCRLNFDSKWKPI